MGPLSRLGRARSPGRRLNPGEYGCSTVNRPDRAVTARLDEWSSTSCCTRSCPPLAKVVWRPAVRGLENVPETGPVILASNHLSFVDSVVIPVVAPRQVVFLAKSDYFDGPGGARRTVEGVVRGPRHAAGRPATTPGRPIASLDVALEVLGRGEAFGIYPEGTPLARRAPLPWAHGRRAPRAHRRRPGRAGRARRHGAHPAGRHHPAPCGADRGVLRASDRDRHALRRPPVGPGAPGC